MKKLFVTTVLALGVCFSTCALASNHFKVQKALEGSNKDLVVINVMNLTDLELKEITQGDRPQIAVEFSEQTTLPLSIFLKGGVINLVGEEKPSIGLQVEQTFYIRWMQEQLLFSLNMTDWKPLAEFVKGTASVTMDIRDGVPSISVGAEVDFKI